MIVQRFIWGRYALFLVFAYVAVMTAWLSDDSLITLRQVWNFVHGDGLTFNFGERVQAFSHPTWFFVISGVVALTDEPYFTVLFFSVAVSLSAVALLLSSELELMRGRLFTISPVVFLLFSVAFCDYLTSGLENPLSFLLIATLFHLFLPAFRGENTGVLARRKVFFVLSLLVLTRFDYAVLFFPLFAYLVITSSGLKGFLSDISAGALVGFGWIVFSLVYFGAPFPNTFYAKMGAGYPLVEVLSRSVEYFTVMLQRDPATLVLIITGVVGSLVSRNKLLISLGFGQLLYLAFVVKSGGGFMQGRFLATPAFLAVAQIVFALSQANIFDHAHRQIMQYTVLASLIIVGSVGQYPFLASPNYDNRVFSFGVADERGFYYKTYGLMSPERSWPKIKPQPDSRPSEYFITCGGLGVKSLERPEMHVIDSCALSEPLLARLPAIHKPNWRVGHHERKIPTGYGEFLVDKIDAIEDDKLQQLLVDTHLSARGDLFTKARFLAIWRLNTGYYSDLEFKEYRDPSVYVPEKVATSSVDYSRLNTQSKPDGYGWNKAGTVVFPQNLKVTFDTVAVGSELYLSLDHNDVYDIYVNGRFVRRIDKVGTKPGLRNHKVSLGYGVPIQEVLIKAMAGDGRYSMGHLYVEPQRSSIGKN